MPKPNWNFYFVPLLMLTVALIQHALVRNQKLTPWKGGGFGMFSTVDSISSRKIKVILIIEDKTKSYNKSIETKNKTETDRNREKKQTKQIYVKLPRSFPKKLKRKLITYPNTKDLRFAAKGLLALHWVKRKSKAGKVEALRLKQKAAKTDQKLKVKAIRLEIWSHSFDQKTNQVSSYPLLQEQITSGS